MILGLCDELLAYLICEVHRYDRYPLILSCKSLHRVFHSLVSRPPIQCMATMSISRIRWAVEVMGATPTIEWCNAAARRGDDLVLFYISGRFDIAMDESTFKAAVKGDKRKANMSLLKMLRKRRTPWDVQCLKIAAASGDLGLVKWLCEEGAPMAEMNTKDTFWAHESNPMASAMKYGHLDIVQYLHKEMGIGMHFYCQTNPVTYLNHHMLEYSTSLSIAVEQFDLPVMRDIYFSAPHAFWLEEDSARVMEDCMIIAANLPDEQKLTWLVQVIVANADIHYKVRLQYVIDDVLCWATVPYLEWLTRKFDDKWVEYFNSEFYKINVWNSVYEQMPLGNPNDHTYDVVRWLYAKGVFIPNHFTSLEEMVSSYCSVAR